MVYVKHMHFVVFIKKKWGIVLYIYVQVFFEKTPSGHKAFYDELVESLALFGKYVLKF